MHVNATCISLCLWGKVHTARSMQHTHMLHHEVCAPCINYACHATCGLHGPAWARHAPQLPSPASPGACAPATGTARRRTSLQRSSSSRRSGGTAEAATGWMGSMRRCLRARMQGRRPKQAPLPPPHPPALMRCGTCSTSSMASGCSSYAKPSACTMLCSGRDGTAAAGLRSRQQNAACWLPAALLLCECARPALPCTLRTCMGASGLGACSNGMCIR